MKFFEKKSENKANIDKDFELLLQKFDLKEISLNKNESDLATTAKLNDVEKEYSFLHNIFVFKKIAHPPDSLYKKLLKK